MGQGFSDGGYMTAFHLHRGEKLALIIVLAVCAVLVILQTTSTSVIIWSAFIETFMFYLSIMGIGVAVRCTGWQPRISLTFIALGFYPLFASFLALTGYLLFPLQRPLIDDTLFAIDAVFGYDWVAAVEWLAQYPRLAIVLLLIYGSSLLQLLLLLFVLGLLGRAGQLHRMLLTGMIAGVLTIGFWSLFPSFGPAAYLMPPPEAIASSRLLVTPDYGLMLMELAQNGIGQIEKHEMLGTVAFPSFHILMACLAVWFARRTWLFWPYLFINILMIPATLVHGGHHLIDLPGGVVLFVICLKLVNRIMAQGNTVAQDEQLPVSAPA